VGRVEAAGVQSVGVRARDDTGFYF